MSSFAFPITSPESQGIPSSTILRFVEAIEKKHLELHSFFLLRHGSLIAKGWWNPYQPDFSHMLFSLSKSFTSTAIGLAVEEGRISVEDPVISFFPDDLPVNVSDNLRAMKVKHLLTMSTGHVVDTTGRLREDLDGNWVKAFLSLDVEHAPGKPFVYNSGATYMLSAIVQKVTGNPVLEYLRKRLFEPLGIENPTWENCPKGINAGGWGLSIRTEDIARFGQLYLNKGVWQGKRLIAEEWVEQASCAQVPNGDNPESDWNQGYGYQFWRCRHGAYRGDGAFGQYCIVMPEQDAVLAITSGVGNMQIVLDLVWKHLLGNMQEKPLRSNPAALNKLAAKLDCLALAEPEGEKASTSETSVSGKVFEFRKNRIGLKSAQFEFAPDHSCTFTVRGNAGEQSVRAGSEQWIDGKTTLFSWFGAVDRALAKGIWIDPVTFQLYLRFIYTPFSWKITCQFKDNSLLLKATTNVSFGPTMLPRLTGKSAK